MQVIDGLPAVSPAVHDKPETFVTNLLFFNDPVACHKEGVDQVQVRQGNIRNGGDMFLGNDDNVNGRLRVDVPERQCVVRFINDRAGNLAFDDLTKKTGGILNHALTRPLPQRLLFAPPSPSPPLFAFGKA